MAKDLNKLYGFKISKALKYDLNKLAILKNNPVKHHNDWEKSCFQSIKDFIRQSYYIPQKRRCSYCRRRLNIDAYYDHLDHIIPKSHHKQWMFVPKNLIITCHVCNLLKNDDDTLALGQSRTSFPTTIAGFTIFNPHFEKWENCFEIEDGMFIRGKNKRGQETIKVCKLYQYQYCVSFSEESQVQTKSVIKRAVLRQRSFPEGSLEHEAAIKIINYYEKLI